MLHDRAWLGVWLCAVTLLEIVHQYRAVEKQGDDMDINCGDIVDGTASIDELGERIFQALIDLASGKPSKSEAHGYGQSEFVPWQLGAVM